MKKGYAIGKRVLALALCLCMIAAWLPNITVPAAAIDAADMTDKVVDPSTINGWQAYFGPNVMSTEYTGGVWTDKSVFQSMAAYMAAAGVADFSTPSSAQVSDAVAEMLATDPGNFLIAMSAITANKSISGSSSAPMDTMLVLDVSGSMQGNNAVAMVRATNQAIETLLNQNTNNRIGVVLYSGNHGYDDSGTDTASILLPLGRYTTTGTMSWTENGSQKSIPEYLTISGNGNNQTVSVHNSVNNGTAADTKTVRGGTYIQNGLYQAWEQFNAVTDTKVPAGQVQAGTQRTPVIVLMSDGAPTAATTSYNNVQTSNLGDGSDTSNRYGFLTQLTAAWVRGKVQAKYGTTPKFYTLGIGTGNSSVATSVLNPAGSNNTINGYWTRFNAGTTGQNVRITDGWGGWSVYKDAAVAGKNYVDEYWLANNANSLIEAFNKIVNTIVLAGEQHSTLVDELGADMSGYVTFEDELGELMEVKDIKGLVIGDTIFTGAELAKGFTTENMGTTDAPTDYGNEFIRTVKERLGITDTAVAQQLAVNAYNAGQLSYTSDTQFSNYIGWYADADGNYVAFWQESDGYGADAAPEGAVYINKSYGYLGAQSTEAGASDMMHVVVMVRAEIATGHQSIVYKIPASLLPAVTYEIALNGNDMTSVKSITRQDAEPLRLLAEVGLRSDINAVNLEDKIAAHIENGGHVHENADGTYTFYTNRWGDGDGGSVDYGEPLTHLVAESHFHPALENERYYHVNDALVYSSATGTVYTGTAAPSGDGYYFARNYYETVGGTPRLTTKYAPLAAVSVAKATQGDDGKWYVPAGTPQQLTRFALAKTDNTTETLRYSWNPVVLHDDDGYNSYTFLGNNGAFTVAPAQGISLTKTVSEAVEGAPTEFTFTVTLDRTVTDPVITDPDGNPLTGVATVSGNVITVKLKADETVYITGLPTGTAYTVAEEVTGYYTANITGGTGTVTAHTITDVAAVNVPKVYNDLIVSKNILHPDWLTDITALEAQDFTIRVTITGADANTTYTTGNAAVTFTTDAAGTATQTITLRDAQSLTVYDLPQGAAYSVAELNVPTGHTANATETAPITGTIPAEGAAIAGVTNTYAPGAASTTVTVTGTKTFLTSGGYTVPDADWPAEGFTVELYSVDAETGTQTLVKGDIKATAANKTWSVAVPLTFDKTGTYFYRIQEKTGTQSDIVYDGTNGLFKVVVTDDASGTLKISEVSAVQGTTTVTGTTVDKDFTNYKDAGSVRIPVKKVIQGTDAISANDFLFGLYDAQDKLIDTVVGNGEFVIAGYAKDFTTAQTYTVKELVPVVADRIVGMNYDDTVYTVTVQWVEGTGMTFNVADLPQGETGPVFTNTYTETVSTPAIDLGGTKTVTGDRTAMIAGESYTFELYETGADFNTVTGTLKDSDTVSGTDYTYGFEGLTFKEAGVYYFVVKEAAGKQGGVTYDAAEYHVTIHVVKTEGSDGNTILAASASIHKLGTNTDVAADELNFTNTYTVSGTGEAVISGTKLLTGRELIAGEFEFGLYEATKLLQSVKNLTNGAFSFEPITYTADDIGTHTYTVREIVPTDKLGGVVYDDDTAYTVTVTVADDGKGGLAVTKTVSGDDDIVFTNAYKPAATSATIAGTKTLYDVDSGTYLPLSSGQFTFELYRSNADFSEQGALVDTAANSAGTAKGDFRFTLNYTEAGDNYYILRETIADADGMSYDAGRYFIRVLVSDDSVGNLYPTTTVTREGVGQTDDIVFGNRYDPEPTQAAISGTKTLTGRPLIDGEFTFELYENGQKIDEAANANGTFTFDAITYEAPGTYTYTVKEHNPAASGNVYKGVTYDTDVETVTVTVTDVDGKLVATVSRTAAQLVFANSYEGADTHFSLTGRKNYAGQTEGQFTFELYDKNDVHIASADNKADGTFEFSYIPLADAGTYTFYLVEKIPEGVDTNNRLNGIKYSEERYDITVTVTDDTATGQLVAGTPTVTKNGQTVALDAISFTNTYNVEPTSVRLWVSKALTGRQLKAGEFDFQLYDSEGALVEQTSNDATGTVAFTPINYHSAGDYTYTVKEVKGAADKGLTYDENEYEITVKVTDNGDGTLATEVVFEGDRPTFRNTYTVQGPATFDIEGTKVLEGRDLTDEDTFVFELKDATGKVVDTATAVNGKFAFTDVQIDALGTHRFTVTEQAPAGGVKDGVSYTEAVYYVEVNVRDDGYGKMVAGQPVYYVDGVDTAEMVFTNTYSVTEGTDFDIVGKKTLSGNKTLTEGLYTFELHAGTDTTGEPLATAKNAADGSITFTDVALDKLGESVFTVVEQIPEDAVDGKLDGVTYSNLVYTVKVTATDNGKGGMTASAPTYYLGDVPQTAMEFINTYAVEGETAVDIVGTKTLTGGKQLQENMFTFELYKDGQMIARVQNAADGTVTFEDVPLKTLGKHTFTVKELTPESGEENGVKYDTTVYTVEVEVTDNGKGGMTAGTPVYKVGGSTANAMTFTNAYTPAEVDVDLAIVKTVKSTGKQTISPEGFTFKIAGDAEATVTSDADGKAAYTLTYDAGDVGETFTYTVTEVKGSKKGVTYSDASYTVAVTVNQNADGTLAPAITVDGQTVTQVSLAFENLFEPAQTPNTGDEFQLIPVICVMVLSAVGMGAVLILKRRTAKK